MKPYGNLRKLRWPKKKDKNGLDMEKIKKMNHSLNSLIEEEKEQRELADWQRIAMLTRTE